jgi:hypothetical protein
MTPMFRFADDFVTRWAALDPVGIGGFLSEPFRAATDYGPDGHEAWADLMSSTLSELDSVPVTSDRDRLAALHMRERLEAWLAWHQAGEPLRDLRSPFGLLSEIRDSADLLAHDDDEDWRNIPARLRAIPEMFSGWRTSLDEGLTRGCAPRGGSALSERFLKHARNIDRCLFIRTTHIGRNREIRSGDPVTSKGKGDLSEDRYRFYRVDAREHGPSAPDDPRPGLLLRRNDQGKERTEHDDDVVGGHHHRDHRLGSVRGLAVVREGQRIHRRPGVPRRARPGEQRVPGLGDP